MNKIVLISLCLLFIAGFSCIQKVNTQADLEAINKASQTLIDGLNADDVDAIMSVLTDDHITMSPAFPALDNLSELRKWHEYRIENFTYRGEFEIKEIQLMGDWAYQYWHVSPMFTPKAGGNPIIDESKGIWLWKRQSDRTWKLARSIWNSDLPVEQE